MGDDFIEPLVETENYAVVRGTDEDGVVIYQVELPNLTLYFDPEEWREFVALITAAAEEE
ncbi:MAG: hypothetical protein CUN55_13690 [Phototrophicales bacterium]|nr:MAG: hypothetical protein CUN55_13690 [Phototrophicales bacterium]